uniref:Secreted protein n=1 Tax=Ascaris lumbricoides TaxID=6252 RepID=A0A0M3HRZ6_ASCLU
MSRFTIVPLMILGIYSAALVPMRCWARWLCWAEPTSLLQPTAQQTMGNDEWR